MGKRAQFLPLLDDWQFHQHCVAANELSKAVTVSVLMEERVPNREFVGRPWCAQTPGRPRGPRLGWT